MTRYSDQSTDRFADSGRRIARTNGLTKREVPTLRANVAEPNVRDSDPQKLCLNGCFTVKPLSEFGRHPRSPDGHASRCKSCENDRQLLIRHGMTCAQRSAIAAAQGGCRVCKRPEPGAKGWVVDHDRSCCAGDNSCGACRRGVLCQWCNTALGYADDDPIRLRAMADYIESGERIDRSVAP